MNQRVTFWKELTLLEVHEDRNARKEFNSLSHYIPVHKFITMPQAMKITDAKAAVDKDDKDSKHCQHRKWSKVKSKRRGHPRGTERAENSPFCFADGHLSSQECEVGTPNFIYTKVVLY